MPADFHGYGYNSWQTPGSWGGSGSAQSRMGIFHGGASGTAGVFGSAQGKPGPGYKVGTPPKTGNVGTMSGLEPLGGIEWGKGTAAIGAALKSGTQRQRMARPRQGGFQTAAGERYIGDVTHQPIGALGPGRPPMPAGRYNAIETTATPVALGAQPRPAGELGTGIRIGQPGPRPMPGPARATQGTAPGSRRAGMAPFTMEPYPEPRSSPFNPTAGLRSRRQSFGGT